MASLRARKAFLKDDSEEESPHTLTARKRTQHLSQRLDSDEDSAPPSAEPVAPSRQQLAGVRRLDDSGDLRPTTPPTGASRNRPADQAPASLSQAQLDALHSYTTGGSEPLGRNMPGAALGVRRHTVAGPRSSSSNAPLTATKAAAARTIDHSSSDDELGTADDDAGHDVSRQPASAGGLIDYEAQASGSVVSARPTRSPRTTRSSRPTNGSAAPSVTGAPVAASAAPSQRSAASSRGVTGAGSALYDELLRRSQASSRRPEPTSRLRRTSSNASMSSEASRPESLASSRQTQASKVTTTVQRAAAQQQFLDSSSGEDEEAAQQQQTALPTPSAAAAGRAKSSAPVSLAASTASAAVAAPQAGVRTSSSRHALGRTAPVPSSVPAARRHTDTNGAPVYEKAAPRHRTATGKVSDPGAFSFHSDGNGSSGEAVSPRMRQVTAAASAEVASAAASSLRPAPLTAVAPAALHPPKRPTAASAPAPRHGHLGQGNESGSVVESGAGFASAGGASRHVQLSSTQRIASWLEQQPSMTSLGVTDDVASVCTTSATGAGHDGGAAMTDRRTTADQSVVATDDHMSSVDIELPGLRQEITVGGARPRAVRLSISSDEDVDDRSERHDANGGGSALTSPSERSTALQRPTGGPLAVTPSPSGHRARAAAGPVNRRLEFPGQAQGASPSDHSSPSFRPSESSPSPDDAPSARVRAGSKSRAATTADSTASRPATAGAAPSPLRVMTTAGVIRPRQDSSHADEAPRSAFEQDPASAQAAAAAARIASAGGLRHRVAPGAASGRMSPGDLRAMLSMLARPAWTSNTSNAPTPVQGTSSAGSGNVAPSDSVQSFSYSELLQMMRAMSSAGGGSLANLHLPPPSVDGSSVRSGRSGSSSRVHRSAATHTAPRSSSAAARAAAAAPSPSTAQRASPPRQKLRATGASTTPPANHGAHPSHGGSTMPATSVGGSSMLMDEHPLAAPPPREWSMASGSAASAALTREEQQQRDFEEMVRLWTLLTGRSVASDAFEGPVEDAVSAAVAAASTPPSVRSVSVGRGVSAPSAAALAASAAAMATSAVIAAASGAFPPHHHHHGYTDAVASHHRQAQPRARSVSPSPMRHGTAHSASPMASVRSPSAAPATTRRSVSSLEAQPRRYTFSSLPPELQQLARLVSSAGHADQDGEQLSLGSTQPSGSVSHTPKQHASVAGSAGEAQDDLQKLVRLLSAAGRSDEQQKQQKAAQTQQAPTAVAEAQTDLVRLVRLLSAAGQTDAPPSTSSASAQTDLVRLVRLLSAAGQTEEARTAGAATSTGGLGEAPTVAAATSTGGLGQGRKAAAATSTGGLGEARTVAAATSTGGLGRTAAAATSTGGLKAPLAAVSTSVAGLAPPAAHAATSTGGMKSDAATSVGGVAPPVASAAVSAGGLPTGTGMRVQHGASVATSTGGLSQDAPALQAPVAAAMAASAGAVEEMAGHVATVCSLSSHNSGDTVETGLALSRLYDTLRGMRVRDDGLQTDPPGVRSSFTQTAEDLAASYRRSAGDQTDAPACTSSGVQTQGLSAETASGAVQTNAADLRAFATRTEGGQTELPSFASACQQTEAVARVEMLDGTAQTGAMHRSEAGQTEAVATSSAGQQVLPRELVSTAEGGMQTELSHLRGGSCRASQTEIDVSSAGAQTDVSLSVGGQPSAAVQTEGDKADLRSALQADFVRVARLVAASVQEQGEPLRLSVEAQAEVARLARLASGGGVEVGAEARNRALEALSSLGSGATAAGTQTVVTRALRLPSGQLVELDPLLPWMAEEAALEAEAVGVESSGGSWMQALRALNAALGDTPASVSFTMPSMSSARRSRLVSDASGNDGEATATAPGGTHALQRALQILASAETDYPPVDLTLSVSVSESALPSVGPISAVRPATMEDGVQTDLTALDLASALPHQLAQPGSKDSPRLFHSAPGNIPHVPATPTDTADGKSVATDSVAATSITAGSVIAPAPAPAAPEATAELPARAPSPPTSTQIGAAIALRNLPIASDGGLMQAPHQEAVVAGRVGSSGGMLAFLEAADPTTATALMELVQALQLMTLHSRRRRFVSDGSSVVSGTYYHHHHHEPPSPPTSLGGSSGAPTSLRGSFVTSIGPSVSQAGEASLAGAAVAAVQADAEAAATAPTPAYKAATVGGAAAPPTRAGGVTAAQRHSHTGGLPPRPPHPRVAVPDPTARHLQRALRAVTSGGAPRSQAPSAGGSGPSDDPATPTANAAATAKPHIVRALELISSGGAAPADAQAAVEVDEEAELQAQEELVAALMALLTSAPAQTAAEGEVELAASSASSITGAPDATLEAQPVAEQPASPRAAEPVPSPRAAALPERDATVPACEPQQQEQEQAPEAEPADEDELAALAPSELSASSSGVSANMQLVLEQAERASASVSTLAGLPPSLTSAAEALDGVPFEQAIGFIMDGLRDFDGGPAELARHLHMMYSSSSGGAAKPSFGGAASTGGAAVLAAAADALASRRQTAVAEGEAATGRGSDPGSPEAHGSPSAPQLTDADRESIQALVAAAVAAAEAAARGLGHQEASPPKHLVANEEAPLAAAEPLLEQASTPSEPEEPQPPSAEQLPPPSFALALSSSRSSSPARPVRPAAAATTGGLHTPVGMALGRFDDGIAMRSSPGILSSIALAEDTRKQTPQQTPPETPVASAMPSPLRLIAHLADLGADAFARLLPGMEEVLPASSPRSAPVTTAGTAPAYTQPPTPQTFGGAMDLPDVPRAPEPHGAPILPCGDLDEHLMPVYTPRVEVLAVEEPFDDAADADLEEPVMAAPRLPTFATPSAPAVRGAPSRSEPTTTAGSAQSPTASSRLLRTFAGAPDLPQIAQAGDDTIDGCISIDVAAGVAAASGALASPESGLASPAVPELPPSPLLMQQQASPAGAVRSAPVTAGGDAQPPTRLLQTAGGSLPSAPAAVAQPVQPEEPEHAPEAEQLSPTDAAVLPPVLARSAPVTVGGDSQHPMRQLQTAGGALGGDADPEIPALTALDRFKAPTPYHASPYRQFPRFPQESQPPAISATPAAVVAAAPAAPPASAWSAAAGSGDEDDAGFANVRLARDVMTGRRERRSAAGQQPTAEEGPRRELFSPSSHGDEQSMPLPEEQEEQKGDSNAAVPDADATSSSPAEQLLTQAAQLLLQAMQRAAEGQPEQEAALHVLSPVLKGLAGAGQGAAPRSAPATMGGSPMVPAHTVLRSKQQQSSPGALPGADSLLLHVQADGTAPLESQSLRQAASDLGSQQAELARTALEVDVPEDGDEELLMPFRSDGGAFSFSNGGGAAAQPETPTAAVPSAGAQQPALATAADLESFKDEIMSSVRSALLEIVDMIGTTVVQHRAASAAGTAPVAGSIAASDIGTEDTDDSESAAGDQQEIRITRSELEAFMFGKAVLSSTAGDDLLGVRLRDLYAPQLPQEEDGELVGGYDAASAATPGLRSLHGVASSAYSIASTDIPQAGSTVASPLAVRPPLGGQRGAASAGGMSASSATHDAGAGAFRSEPGSVTVPRNSALRQPLGDAADFKSLFRRSLEHLRGHLGQPHHGSALEDGWRNGASRSISGSPSPSSTPAAPASPVLSAARKPPVPPKRSPLHHNTMPGTAPAALAAAAGAGRAASAPGDAGRREDCFEATLAQGMAAQQMADAAAAAVADLEASARAADDVELDMHLSAGLRPDSPSGALRWPDPAAPGSQGPSAHGGTEGAESFGEFLAALAEPAMQVAGLFLSPDPLAGSRHQPTRTVVIEELQEGEECTGAQRAEDELQHPHFRPSRGMPGHVGSGGGVVLPDEDAAAFSPARALFEDSPRARSEASIPRLRLRPPPEQTPTSRSTSATPMPGAAPKDASSADHDMPSSPPVISSDLPRDTPNSGPGHLMHPTRSSRLKLASSPGSRDCPSDQDRPLSSFAASEGGKARTSSPLRRRTISPPRPLRDAVAHAEAVTIAPAPEQVPAAAQEAAKAAAVPMQAPGSAAAQSSLEELESFLQAFKSRISTDADEAGDALRVLRLLQPLGSIISTAAPAAATDSAVDPADIGEAEVLSRATVAMADAWAVGAAPAGEDGDDSEVSVMKGFNLHTIRASAASALAAAAAVEQTFSPRHEKAEAAAAAGMAGSGVATGAVNSRGGSSTATPTNPLLREHLEHFQALLEKANDLVDRLMFADDEAVSEAGTEAGATPTPEAARGSVPTTAGSVRRQLHERLSQAVSDRTPPPKATSKSRSRRKPRPASPSASEASEVSAVTPPPVAGSESSLDPELAALFPATAARLSCPDALTEQSPDAANALVSTAVSAVPQLAVGASRARSLSSTPLSRSPAASLGGVSVATAITTGAAAATPGEATAGAPTATPLALVAALLAEAHSRMEFRSLEEQRGADKILSAVLDEHFATVLGTPRGFLTPHREPAWLHAAAQAPLERQSSAAAAAAADLSAAFNEVVVQVPGDGRLARANQSVGVETTMSLSGQTEPVPQPLQQRASLGQKAPGDVPEASTALVLARPALTPAQQQPQPRSELGDLFSLIMQQRGELLTSALDQVHRAAAAPAAATSAAGPLPPAAVAAAIRALPGPGDAAPPAELPEPFSHPPPQRISVAAALPQPMHPHASMLAAAQLQELPMVLAALSIPATSVGQHNLPQPLMPYQEYDSESNPASYNVSIAGSARHTGSIPGDSSYARLPSGRFESPAYSRGPSARGSLMMPPEVAAAFFTRQAAAFSAGGVAMPSAANPSLGGASAASAPAAVAIGASSPPVQAQAAASSAVDLSYLVSESGSLTAAPRSMLGGIPEVASRVGSTTEGSGFGRIPSHPVRSPEEENSESASLVSYTTGHAVYEQRDTELAAFSAAMDRSAGGASTVPASPVGGPASVGGSSIHDGALRYNPIYDPADQSIGGASMHYGVSAGGAVGCYSSSGGSSASDSVAQSGASRGLMSLHHETAYAPLALVAAAAAAVADAAVTPSVGGAALHSRLLSAGGTSTAVLDHNPAYDLHEDSVSRPTSTAGAPPRRLEVSLSGGMSAGGADPGLPHPRLQLDFESSDADACSARSLGQAGAGMALPLTPVGLRTGGGLLGLHSAAGSVTGVSEGLPSYPLVAGSDADSLPASSDDLPSLMMASLTESQLALLSMAPELPPSQPHSRAMPRFSAGPATQLQPQPLSQQSTGGASLSAVSAASAGADGRFYSAGGASEAGASAYYSAAQSAAPSAVASRAASQAGAGHVPPATQLQSQRLATTAGLVAPVASTDGEVTGSIDFEELSREAAAVVDCLGTAAPAAQGLHDAAQSAVDPLNSTIRVRSPRGLIGGNLAATASASGSRDGSRASSAAGAPASLPLEALLPGTGFGARPEAEHVQAAARDADASPAVADPYEAPAGPLTAVAEDTEEEEQTPERHVPATAGRPKGSLVAAAIRRFESGVPPSGPSALHLPVPAADAPQPAGVMSPKPVFKPVSRTPSGLPRAPGSPGALQGGMSPAGSAGPASRAASGRSSRRSSASSLPDEDIREAPVKAAAAALKAAAEAAAVAVDQAAEEAETAEPTAAVFEPSVVSSDAAFFAAGSPGISMSFSEEPLGPQCAAAPTSSGEAFYVASGTPGVSSDTEDGDEAESAPAGTLVTREWVPAAEEEDGGAVHADDAVAEVVSQAVPSPARSPTVVAFGRSTSASGMASGRPASPAQLRAVRGSSPGAATYGSSPAGPAPQRAASGAAALAMARAGRAQSPVPTRHKSSTFGGANTRSGSQPASPAQRLRNSTPGGAANIATDAAPRSPGLVRQRPSQADGGSRSSSRGGSQSQSPVRAAGATSGVRGNSASVPGGRVAASAGVLRGGSASLGGVSAEAQACEPVPLHEAVRAYRTSRRPQL